MPQTLRNHLEKFVKINDKDFAELLRYFRTTTVAKKHNLLQEGEICKYHYFVASGLLRKFFVNERGIEQTTEFAIETWWLTDNTAFERRSITDFYIQAVEKSELFYISWSDQEKLLERFPFMERYFRFIYQRAYAASQIRIKYLYSLSKEEFYYELENKYPKFVQRVPQYLIASYLGFTPEYLSEIRKRRTAR